MKKKAQDASPFAKLKELKDKLAREEEAQKAAGKKPKAPPTRAPARPAPGEEDMSFARLMGGVAPLDGAPKRLPKAAALTEGSSRDDARKAASEARTETEDARSRLRDLALAEVAFEVTDDGTQLEGRRVDVPPQTLRKLRHGAFPVDGTLDLHGLTASEAQPRLLGFLAQMRSRREKCVLVVHGKGHGSPGGISVLRGEIAAWLSQGGAREHVDAFASATAGDGGSGAIYVLLRR